MSGKTKDEYADANVPGHVKAIDQRRAKCMPVVDNVKLGEWSQEISLILHWLEQGKASEGFMRGVNYGFVSTKLEILQASIVGAMGKPDTHLRWSCDVPNCPKCEEYERGLVRSNDEWAI